MYSLADGGYLIDPEGEHGSKLNPNLAAFDQLQSVSCLALLGEPGLGKSWSLNQEANSTRSFPVGATTVRIDLRGYGSEERLLSAIFDSDLCKQWESGTDDLYLYLDSLDECLLRIDNIASLLADELPKHPLARLKLRIVCRTASWPPLLERALTKAYGETAFAAYELVPLRRCDVELAAQVAGVRDVGRFIERIRELNIEPFATKPITLGFLIETFLQDGDLPTRALDLYERGCQILCEEQSESRRASGRIGALPPTDRMAIASRIAAATQLGNRYAIWTGTQAAWTPPEDVPIESIAIDSEEDTHAIQITRASIMETLDSGLFSSRGPERLGWAHQTLAEYLAARYCIRHKMPIQQLRAILFHPRRGRIVPQLRDVAS
jgi:predicted NACHT family NTPase